MILGHNLGVKHHKLKFRSNIKTYSTTEFGCFEVFISEATPMDNL